MVKLLKTDIKLILKTNKVFMILFILGPLLLVSFMEEKNWSKIGIIYFVTSMASLVNFEEGDRDTKKITLSLPITRREYVYSKYLMPPILLIINISIVLIGGIIFRGLSINKGLIISLNEIMVAILLSLITISLCMPWYFVLPSKVGLFFSLGSLLVINVILGMIDGIGTLLETSLITRFAGVGAIALGLFIFFISAIISAKIFEVNDI